MDILQQETGSVCRIASTSFSHHGVSKNVAADLVLWEILTTESVTQTLNVGNRKLRGSMSFHWVSSNKNFLLKRSPFFIVTLSFYLATEWLIRNF